MTQIPYTYCVLKYTHDPVAGETLNIGVLLYAPTVPYTATLVEYRDARLAQTFAGFDSEHYQRTLRRFEEAIRRIRDAWAVATSSLARLPTDAGALGAQVWPDPDLSFRVGPVLAGVCEDLDAEVRSIFRRMVSSQYSTTPVDAVAAPAEVAVAT